MRLTRAKIDAIVETEIEDHLKWVTGINHVELTDRERELAYVIGRTISIRAMRKCGFLEKIEAAEYRAIAAESDKYDREHKKACKRLKIPY